MDFQRVERTWAEMRVSVPANKFCFLFFSSWSLTFYLFSLFEARNASFQFTILKCSQKRLWQTFSLPENVGLLLQNIIPTAKSFIFFAKCAKQFVHTYRHTQHRLWKWRKDKAMILIPYLILSFFSSLRFSGLCVKFILVIYTFPNPLQNHIYFLPSAYSTVSHSEDGIILSEIVTLNYSREACRCKTCCLLMQIREF